MQRAKGYGTRYKTEESVSLVLEFIPGAPLHTHFFEEDGFQVERARSPPT